MQPCDAGDRYDFDAPDEVFDFKTLKTDDNADQWFDRSKDAAITQHATPQNSKSSGPTGKTAAQFKKNDKDSRGDEVIENNPPSNIVVSWGDNKPTALKQTRAQPRRVSKRPAVEPKAATPPNKRQKTLPTPKRSAGRSKGTALTKRERQALRSNRRPTRKSANSKEKTHPPSATVSTNQLKTTEQQEIERIEALQNEVAEQRRRNEASYKAALAGSQLPKKPVLSNTIPKEFNFRSDARLKRSASSSSCPHVEVDFSSQLRKHGASPIKAPPRGATVPKPFNLSQGEKQKSKDTPAYVPIAEQIKQYERRTPPRYHLRSRQSQGRGPSPVKAERPKITHPVTPQLMTLHRSRPLVVKSSAEIEAEELEKIHQFKFKALELNRKILDAAIVPKKPAVKEVTQPEGFQLEIEKRLKERQTNKKTKHNEDFTFHSKPVPAKILDEVVGVPEKHVPLPTMPESPAFALKNRVRVERKVEEVKPAPIKAMPIPHSVPFHPKLPAKTVLELCPFSFEEREKERKAMKERKLMEHQKEKSHEFKATPLPDFSEVNLPEKKVLEPTKPAPFRLQIDERGAAKNYRWEKMMQEELKQQAEAACFKARPNVVTHKDPFLPKKENRSILENSAAVEPFQLSTERRAKERQEFEREKSEREALRVLQQQKRQQEQEEHEHQEVERLRQELVHKAQPIRHYKQVEVKKSELPLTIPQSPDFSDRFHI